MPRFPQVFVGKVKQPIFTLCCTAPSRCGFIVLRFVFEDAGFNTRWLAWIAFAAAP
jgi:hypothetical protein